MTSEPPAYEEPLVHEEIFKDSLNKDSLKKAIDNEDTKSIKFLIENKHFFVNADYKNVLTVETTINNLVGRIDLAIPLLYAVHQHKLESTKCLLEHGANAKQTLLYNNNYDSSENTISMVHFKSRLHDDFDKCIDIDKELLHVLVEHGMDINFVSFNRKKGQYQTLMDILHEKDLKRLCYVVSKEYNALYYKQLPSKKLGCCNIM